MRRGHIFLTENAKYKIQLEVETSLFKWKQTNTGQCVSLSQQQSDLW